MSLQNILVNNSLNLFCRTLNGMTVGPQGQFIGPQGIQGIQGPQGLQGLIGSQGLQGLQGPQLFNQQLNTNSNVTFADLTLTDLTAGLTTGVNTTLATSGGVFAYFNNVAVGDSVLVGNTGNKICIGVAGGVGVNSQLAISANLVKVNAFIEGAYATPTGVVGATSVVGTGATITATGSQLGGTITLTTGTGSITTTGTIATMTFSTVATPIAGFGVILFPANANAAIASLGFFAIATSTTTFTISNSANLTASSAYIWNWTISM